MSHEKAGESPPTPYMMLQAKLEELDAYTHTALQQFPNAERHLMRRERSTLITYSRE